jgi:hypothetical protein
MRLVHSFWLTLGLCLSAGCARNMLLPWVKPDTFELPLALASASVTTNQFTFRSARYGIYLFHYAPCSVIQMQNPTNDYERNQQYKGEIPCDISIAIHLASLEGPVLFQQRITNAKLGMSSSDDAFYDLGYFETSERETLVMVLSNAPGAHDDSICHARVVVSEILTK